MDIGLVGSVSHKTNENRRDIMGSKANPEDIVPLWEALNMEIIVNQALIDILVSNGVITQEELMAKIEEIRTRPPEKQRLIGNISS